MIIASMKKVLSSIVIAVYLIVYAAPVGFCVSTAPQIDTGIQKPVLRGGSQSSALKLEGDISITKGNPKISLSLRDSDVKQVLRMFADKAGLNIIFHDSVSGKVTMDLVNVPLNDAFKMVLQVTNLTYFIDHNTMVVTSADAAQKLNLAKQELMVIPVKYVDAAALATFLNKNIFSINKPGLSNSNIAITNPSANEILIFGTKNDYLMAKKVIEQFDKKPLDNTFIVNHTTPKEMADLVCNVLFKSLSDSSGSTTGGASSTGSSSIGSSSSGGSVSDLTLGAGIVACQYKNTVDAGALASLNTSSLTVAYFPQRGTVSVMGGSQQQMQLVKDFIEENDKKQPQAYLEVSVIELNETGTREFDNTWRIWSKYFSGTFNGSTTTNPLYPTFLKGDGYTLVDPGTYPPTIKQIVSKYTDPMMISYAINYIIQNQKGRVLANPRIMITNGQESVIDLSSDYVKTVTSQYITNTGSLTPIVQRTYEIASDEGIKVSMVPFISPDGYVTLNLKPEYSTEKEKVYAPTSNDTPNNDLVATLLQRRNLDLKNIRIKDGETLVIGGMIRESELKNVSKIPVLGDLPGIGACFRNSQTTKEKNELIIMITPTIIKDPEDIVKNSNVTL